MQLSSEGTPVNPGPHFPGASNNDVAATLPSGMGDHLMRAVWLINRVKQRAGSPHPEVDHESLPLLFVLSTQGMRLSELTAALHAEMSTVSRQVTHLVDRQLIQRESDPADARARLLTLTDEGRAVLAGLRARRDTWLGQVMAQWDPAELNEFARLLSRFSSDLHTHSENHLTTMKENP